VDRTKVEKFRDNVPKILEELAEDINSQFPGSQPFSWNRPRKAYSKVTKVVKKWIAASPYASRWLKTETGDYSLSLEAFEDHFSYSHNYPRGNFAAQYIRYLKTAQSLNGFMPLSARALNKETFFDYFGPDNRARTYLNPFGSQSSRYQPKATGYIPLKSAWMRSLIEPKSGKMIVGIDYASQEFLIAAILSQDKKMYQAYASGDPYLYLGKLCGAIPEDGTKQSHKLERDLMKATTLGISYLMGPDALAKKLSRDTGKEYTKLDAEKLTQTFFRTYNKYHHWIQKTQDEYYARGYLQLLDGWVMFGDNPNHRSVSNCPVQGAGACILRKAIQLCQDAKLRVIIPLHDALYFEIPAGDWAKVVEAKDLMREAFLHYFKGPARSMAEAVRSDINAWGPELIEGSIDYGGIKIKTQQVYIDDRSKSEYEQFKKYLT
jgi:hypothetical protein